MSASETLPKPFWKAPRGAKEDYWGCLCGQKPVKNRYIFLVNFRRFPEGPWKGLRHGFDLTPPRAHGFWPLFDLEV